MDHQHFFDRYTPNPAGSEPLVACACGVTRTAVFSVYPDSGVKTLSPESYASRFAMAMNEKDQTIRALAAEVEKLREVARAAMKEHQPDGYRVDGHDYCPTCDALAKWGEEG